MCFGANFSKSFAQFSTAGRILEKFQKNQKKKFKIPKTPKIVPKRIQTCFDGNLGQFFRKKFAQLSMEGRVFEIFQKNQKIFQNSKNAQKCSQNYPHVF